MSTSRKLINLLIAMLVASGVLASIILLTSVDPVSAKGGITPLGCPITESCCANQGPCHSCDYNYYERWHYERICDYCFGWCSPWTRVDDGCSWCGPG